MLYVVLRAIFRVCFTVFFRLKVIGREAVPSKGAVVLCSNHISVMDPPIVGTPLRRKLNFMAKAELFKVPVIGWAIPKLGAFPVKRGGVSKDSIRHSIRLLEEGGVLCIFPQGTRGNTGMGKKGAASLALKSRAVVIPVAIIGNYRLFRPMKVVYGAPVDLSAFHGNPSSESLEQATEKIMESIGALIRQHQN